MPYSEKLGLNYQVVIEKTGQKTVIFEDKITYRQKEMDKIKKCSVDQIKMIHALKKEFEGIII